MLFVSFAQNFEDLTLYRALRDIPHGFYIDVGAFHAEHFSVTKAFYDRGWSGVNIEPNPRLLHEISRARTRDINLCTAIADTPGSVRLTIFENEAFSTTTAETVTNHGEGHHVREVVTVPAITLNSVWSEHVKPGGDVHFLKLDIEGGERDVIRSFDWNQYRPWIVVVESTRPSTDIDSSYEWEDTILNANYSLAYNDRLNRFYVAAEHEDLVARLALPPSVHDGFILAEQASLRARVAELEEVNESLLDSIADLQQSIDERWHELDAASARYAALTASYSWRITRPLRAMSRTVRGWFRRSDSAES